jgi:murein DD-endopeptidase MepM/ murein hydrolase activator NlpD
VKPPPKTRHNPGWLHAGEDWYLADGARDTAGAAVYAIGPDEVVFAGSEYPGLVVIVRHDDGLFAMLGHLAYDIPVAVGQRVAAGERLGSVLARTDGRAPSHLHVEVRTFLTTPEVNGTTSRYPVACGVACPPGPGYWPIGAPEHPSAMGWRNPTHAVARRTPVGPGAEAVVAAGAPPELALWSRPDGDAGAEPLGALAARPGDRLPLLAIEAGAEDATGTGAEATRLWYRIAAPGRDPAWVRAAAPFVGDAGSDGRPSSLRFDLLPAAAAP